VLVLDSAAAGWPWICAIEYGEDGSPPAC